MKFVILTVCFQLKQLKAHHMHIFIYIHYHRVYDELTIDHLSMWLRSSVDRALHQYPKVMDSNPNSNFFRLLFQLLKLKAHCKDHKFHSASTVCPIKHHIIFYLQQQWLCCFTSQGDHFVVAEKELRSSE